MEAPVPHGYTKTINVPLSLTAVTMVIVVLVLLCPNALGALLRTSAPLSRMHSPRTVEALFSNRLALVLMLVTTS